MSAPLTNLEEARIAFNSRDIVVRNRPTRVTIETTAICNLRCVMCPHSIDAVDRPKHLSAELFETVRGTISTARWIQLNGIGEPLTSPSLWLALEDKDISEDSEVVFNTNMTILNKKRIDRLLAVRARLSLNVSLDAATPATYRRIRGAPFETPMNNLKALIAARGSNPYPKIMLNMTLMRENIEEIVEFVELAKSLGADEVGFWHINEMSKEEMDKYRQSRDGWEFDYASQGLWNYPELSNAKIRAAIERGKAIDIPVMFDESKSIFFDEEPTARLGTASTEPLETVCNCTFPWDSFLVSSNGEARVCCYAAPVGNINKSSFDELWNGEKFQSLRKDLSKNVVNALCQTASCKYVLNMRSGSRDDLVLEPEPEFPLQTPATPVPDGRGGRLLSVVRKIGAMFAGGKVTD